MINGVACCLYFVVLLKYPDPGIIKSTPEDDASGFFKDIDEDRGAVSICSNDRIRRPLRSKHCRNLDRCVARFDHYCPWISNAIGVNNHHIFLVMLILILVVYYWFYRFVILSLPSSTQPTFFAKMMDILEKERLMCYLFIQAIFYGVWLTFQLIQQIYLICVNMTVNERINKQRYPYFWLEDGQFCNPFDQGSWIKNVKDFLYPSVDWMNVFYLEVTPNEIVVT